MYSIYVIISQKDGTRYIGFTSKDPKIRTNEHNSNKGKFTRGHQPWKLIYTEQFEDKNKALLREKFIKSGKGRKWMDKKITK